MDLFNQTLLDLWTSLFNNQVKYIMVGGLAVNVNGYNRTTDDFDIWIEDNIENRKNLSTVFQEFGYTDIDFTNFEFIPGWTSLYIGNGSEIDILTSLKGLENLSFNECLKNSIKVNISKSIEVPFLHIEHLIQNKEATNRPKDQLDVIELKKLNRKD